jgi:hypothetical protein
MKKLLLALAGCLIISGIAFAEDQATTTTTTTDTSIVATAASAPVKRVCATPMCRVTACKDGEEVVCHPACPHHQPADLGAWCAKHCKCHKASVKIAPGPTPTK